MAVISKPTVNLNGTDRDTLLQQHLDAAEALRAAIKALDEAAPNGRDYLPPGGDIKVAIAFHVERRKLIESVLRDVEELGEHIAMEG